MRVFIGIAGGVGLRVAQQHRARGDQADGPVRRKSVGRELQPGNESVMLVTALSPVIGYEKSAHVTQKTMMNDSTLEQAASASGDVDEATYDKVMNPRDMAGRGYAGA